MLIDPNDLIDIVIYYKSLGKQYIAYNQKDFDNKKFSQEEKSKYHIVKLKMRRLTWGLYNELQDAAMVDDPSNVYKKRWDNRLFKENKLNILIMSWDAKRKNSKGELEPVPLNPETISNLSPDVAEAILTTYDSLSILNNDEEKKIAGSVHSYVLSNGRSGSSANRIMIESDLIDEYHWLPQDIAKIPYKSLQLFYLVRREKQNARSTKRSLDETKEKANSANKKRR